MNAFYLAPVPHTIGHSQDNVPFAVPRMVALFPDYYGL